MVNTTIGDLYATIMLGKEGSSKLKVTLKELCRHCCESQFCNSWVQHLLFCLEFLSGSLCSCATHWGEQGWQQTWRLG